MTGFENFQKLGKDNMDLAMESFGSMSKGMQSIAAEMTDYSRKSFEEGAATLEKLMAAKSVDKAVEIQGDYVRSAWEGFLSRATRMGELYADLAKDAYKPFEATAGKAQK